MSKLQRFTAVAKPEKVGAYVFGTSFALMLIESIVAAYKEGIRFAAQVPVMFLAAAEAVMRAMSHSPRAPVHVPEIRVTAQQAQFAVHLFSVWFIVTFVLVLLDLLYHFLVYPLLCNPSLPDYVQDVIGDCKSVIRFIRRSLRNHR